MRLPSKNTSFSDSIIAKFPAVLRVLEQGDMSPTALYKALKNTVEDISEFVEILDCLYVLEKLEINAETRLLHYVD